VYCINTALLDDMEMLGSIAELSQYTSGEVKFFDLLIKRIKEIEKVVKKLDDLYDLKGYRYISYEPTWMVDRIIVLSKRWKITFESISSYLIKKLGKNLAKKLIKKETILEHYGSNALSIWESLLKES